MHALMQAAAQPRLGQPSSAGSARPSLSAAPALAAPLRRRAPSGSRRVAAPAGDVFETVQAVSQLATTVAAAGCVWLALQQSSNAAVQDHSESGTQKACPVCSGSGFEECLCNKWSDGDVGCSSCSKTGYMRCRGCGGGGRATPLYVKVPERRQ